MDVHLNSLNVRFWSRRETILRPVLWSLEDLRLFGCRFGDIHTSQLQGHVATPFEAKDSSAATGPDALRACLFITNPSSPQDILLFDADIPTALLDELDDPRIVPQRRTRLVIHRTRMSIEPREDFLARLVAALSSRADDNAADGEGWGGGEGRGDGADEEGSGRQET
ncbi:hypothetical protein MY11210_008721 [Beauveria gryllotalpidicola]